MGGAGPRPPALANGLGALAAQQTGLSCEEEEMAAFPWWLRRMTRMQEGCDQPNRRAGSSAASRRR